MYSRYKSATYDPRDEDADADVSEDEYELYRYNLPPRYDGSRFRQRSVLTKENPSDPIDVRDASEKARSSNAENEASPSDPCEKAEPSPAFSLSKLTSRGYEDLLIICIILLLTEKGDGVHDVTLLLLLLLAAK